MFKDTVFNFCARVGYENYYDMANCLKFWANTHVSVNISKTVQDRDILSMEDFQEITCSLSYGISFSDFEWPWRSFPGCRSFEVQSVEHLCSILPDLNWEHARAVPERQLGFLCIRCCSLRFPRMSSWWKMRNGPGDDLAFYRNSSISCSSKIIKHRVALSRAAFRFVCKKPSISECTQRYFTFPHLLRHTARHMR